MVEQVFGGEGEGLYLLVLIASRHVSYPAVQYILHVCRCMILRVSNDNPYAIKQVEYAIITPSLSSLSCKWLSEGFFPLIATFCRKILCRRTLPRSAYKHHGKFRDRVTDLPKC